MAVAPMSGADPYSYYQTQAYTQGANRETNNLLKTDGEDPIHAVLQEDGSDTTPDNTGFSG